MANKPLIGPYRLDPFQSQIVKLEWGAGVGPADTTVTATAPSPLLGSVAYIDGACRLTATPAGGTGIAGDTTAQTFAVLAGDVGLYTAAQWHAATYVQQGTGLTLRPADITGVGCVRDFGSLESRFPTFAEQADIGGGRTAYGGVFNTVENPSGGGINFLRWNWNNGEWPATMVLFGSGAVIDVTF